jgi:hypothetical protein
MKPQLSMEMSRDDGMEIYQRQKFVQGQWYAIQMDFAYKQMQKERRELRAEESAKYLHALEQMDGGIGHFVHTITQ